MELEQIAFNPDKMFRRHKFRVKGVGVAHMRRLHELTTEAMFLVKPTRK